MMKSDEMTTMPDDDDNSLGARFGRIAIPLLCFTAGFGLLMSGIAWGAMQVAKGHVASADMAGSVIAALIGGVALIATFRKWPTLAQGDPITPRTRRYGWAMVALIGFGLPDGFAQVLADSDARSGEGALADDSGTLSRLIGRPTTPIAETIAAAL